MALSEKEIDKLITKIREKFKACYDKYKSGWFNVEGFNDRLKIALQKRMNLEGFLLAEIKNLEDLKDKHEADLKKKDAPESAFTKQVNRIIEENIERISKYKAIKFHPNAGIEISHFYGAITEFTQNYFSILWAVLREQGYRNVLNKLENDLSYVAVPSGSKHPKKIEDHIFVLSRQGTREIEIEKSKNEYLKISSFILHDIIDFMDRLIEIRNEEWEPPLKFDKLFVEGKRKDEIINNFRNLTGYGAIIKVRDSALQIIKDFRLEAFRRKAI